jgi:hypothetical protein
MPPSSLEWAAAVRAAYVLSPTEDRLVALADEALTLAENASLAPMVRLAAMARFAQLVRQIDLEVPDGQAQSAGPGTSARPWPRRVG